MAAQDSKLILVPGQLREVTAILDQAKIPWELRRGKEDISVEFDRGRAKSAGPQFGGLRCSVDIPKAIDRQGDIERQSLPDFVWDNNRVAYWAYPDQLVAAGIATRDQVTKARRWSKGSASGVRGMDGWRSKFAPSGKVLFTTWVHGTADQRAKWKADEDRERSVFHAVRRGERFPISRNDDGRGCVWTGHRDDLIAAGVCLAHHFPDGGKRTKYGHEEDCDPTLQRTEIVWYSTKLIAGDYFQHAVHWSTEGRERQPAPPISKRPAHYESLGEYAEFVEDLVAGLAECLVPLMDGSGERERYGACTMRYDEDTIRKVGAALEHATQLLQAATPTPVKRQVAPAVTQRAVGFDTFMQRLIGRDASAPPL